jgi:ClpP class serine protease
LPDLRTYTLTPALLATHAGAQILALAADERIVGAQYRLSAEHPAAYVRTRTGAAPTRVSLAPDAPAPPPASVTRAATVGVVSVEGPIQERAGYHDPCGGFTAGYDSIAAAYCGAHADPGVDALLMSFRSPGGVAAGMFSCIDRCSAAKAASGKYVVGFIDGECGSAAYALAATLCDVLVMPGDGWAGSIGCRAGTYNQSAALEQAGVKYTAWGWPPSKKDGGVSGKLAGHPDLPPQPLHDERGARDTADLGEMFGKAVDAARSSAGLTLAAIMDLEADMRRGPDALALGLVDMLGASEDAMALAMSKAMERRMADQDDDDEDRDSSVPPPPQTNPAAPPVIPAAPPPYQEGPPRMSKLASFAALVGLGPDTPEPTILAALTPLSALGRATMKAATTADPEDAMAWVKRAGQALAAEPARVKALADAQAVAETARRFKAGDALVAKGHDPGKVFLYGEGPDGQRIRTGLVEEYAAPSKNAAGEEVGMTIGTLEAFVKRAPTLAGAPAGGAGPSPFAEPQRRAGAALAATDPLVQTLASKNGVSAEAMAAGMTGIDEALRGAT